MRILPCLRVRTLTTIKRGNWESTRKLKSNTRHRCTVVFSKERQRKRTIERARSGITTPRRSNGRSRLTSLLNACIIRKNKYSAPARSSCRHLQPQPNNCSHLDSYRIAFTSLFFLRSASLNSRLFIHLLSYLSICLPLPAFLPPSPSLFLVSTQSLLSFLYSLGRPSE